MRLRTQTTLYFGVIMILLLGLTGTLVFWALQDVVEEETDESLRQQWLNLEPLLAQSQDPGSFARPDLEIRALPNRPLQAEPIFSDTLILEAFPDEDLDEEPYRVMTIEKRFPAGAFQLRFRKGQVDAEDLLETLFLYFMGGLLLLILAMLAFQFWVAARLWRPFSRILQTIARFDLTQTEPVQFAQSSTTEFQELSDFLEKMTYRIQTDYQHLKHFTENAAHELQTPLSVIGTKLERLLQSPHLSATEMRLVGEAMEAMQRLKRLNSGLLFLSKIENQQFAQTESVDLHQVMDRELRNFSEQLELRELSYTQSGQSTLPLQIHPVLGEVLISNLLSNAIRHNTPGGRIRIEWESDQLLVANTGPDQALSSAGLFQRFGKSGTGGESSGLGLAIVKEICQQYGWELSYEFEAGWHVFSLAFSPTYS